MSHLNSYRLGFYREAAVYLVSSHHLRNVGDTVGFLAIVGLRHQLIDTNRQRLTDVRVFFGNCPEPETEQCVRVWRQQRTSSLLPSG